EPRPYEGARAVSNHERGPSVATSSFETHRTSASADCAMLLRMRWTTGHRCSAQAAMSLKPPINLIHHLGDAGQEKLVEVDIVWEIAQALQDVRNRAQLAFR